MSRRIGIIAASVCLSLVLLWAAMSQGRQLSNLREEQREMLARLAAPSEQTTAPTISSQQAGAENESSASGSSELLRLRSEVNRLTRRKQELASAVAENERLKAQLERAQTNAAALPPDYLNKGYIRRTTAQKAGFGTPQTTLETFLWAVQHHDSEAFLECLTPESRQKLEGAQQNGAQSFDQIFSHAAEIPGLRIIRSVPNERDGLKLEVEAAPGMPLPSGMNVRQINGEWKLAFFE